MKSNKKQKLFLAETETAIREAMKEAAKNRSVEEVLKQYQKENEIPDYMLRWSFTTKA